MVRGVGNVLYRSLLAEFGEPVAVLRAPRSRLEQAGVRAEVAAAIAAFDRWSQVEDQLRRVQRSGAALVTWSDPRYPALLRQIHDPPPFLFVRGELGEGEEIAVAVVGTRAPSAYGRHMTRVLCEGLARMGITVVSGLARGIDAEAHQAALRAGGRTMAVLGSGIDVVYPAEHHSLFQSIASRGAAMTEFLMGTTPEAENFPHRNRIISGLSLGTVVVEATERSGSLITAQYASEQGREVFAVPGPVGARSRGPHRLIQQGAKLTEKVEDIVEEIAPRLLAAAAQQRREEPASEREQRILGCLDEQPAHVDEIIARAGVPAAEVLEVLLALELEGRVQQLPGKFFAAAPGAERGGG